jgi:hypothetical protein
MAHEREASVERIIAFSDGVVAIAITLLILPLTEIHATEGATLADIVVENGAALGAFALSFAVIASYLAHHPELTDGEATTEGRQHVVASAFSIAAILVALIISLFSPSIGLLGLLLLYPAQLIAGRVNLARPVNS